MSKKKFQTSNVVVISLAHFTHDIYTSFMGPLLPALISKLGISLTLAGLLDVIRKIPSLFTPAIGIIADKISLKYMTVFAPAFTATTMCLLGIAPSYTVLAILLFTGGITTAIFHVPCPVMIKKFSGDKPATGMSFYMFGGELARTVGPLIITAALSRWGLEGSLRVLPIGLLATVILFFKLRKIEVTPPKSKRLKPDGKTATIKKLLPFFSCISGFLLSRAFMKIALTLYLPTYLVSHGKSIWLAGVALSVLQLSGAMGVFLIGYISDKLNCKKTLLIMSIFNPLTMFLFLSNSQYTVPILIVTGFFMISSGPVVLTVVQSTNTDRPAFVNSIYMSLSFGISAFATTLVGLMGDIYGLDTTFKVCAILAIFAVPFIIFLPTKFNTTKEIENED